MHTHSAHAVCTCFELIHDDFLSALATFATFPRVSVSDSLTGKDLRLACTVRIRWLQVRTSGREVCAVRNLKAAGVLQLHLSEQGPYGLVKDAQNGNEVGARLVVDGVDQLGGADPGADFGRGCDLCRNAHLLRLLLEGLPLLSQLVQALVLLTHFQTRLQALTTIHVVNVAFVRIAEDLQAITPP